MPKRRSSKLPIPQHYDLSDSSDDEGHVTLERYLQADLKQGLLSKRNRVRAVRELAAVVDQQYRKAVKGVQLAIFEDLLTAVKVLDRRPVYSEELSKLVRQAQRVLPQQKRNQINKELKATQLAQKRSGKKAGGSSGEADESDADEEELVFGHLPLEVVGTIFSHLDPVALAASTCVSRAWKDISYDSPSWRTWWEAATCHHQPTPPPQPCGHGSAVRQAHTASSSQRHGSHHAAFCHLVRDRPAMLLPWLSDRVLLNRHLGWQGLPDGGGLQWIQLFSLPRTKLQRAGMGPLPVTIPQVLLWLEGEHLRVETLVCRADNSSSDDASDEDDTPDGLPLRLWNVNG